MDHGADVIEFPKWKKTILPVDLTKVQSYDSILFTSPEIIEEFFTAVFEKGVDIRKIRADFFGASIKSVKALNERGFIAKLAEEMPESGALLIVGDDSILKKNDENADLLVTSKKELDHQFLPIFKRMLEEADVNTMVFPSSTSVEPFVEGLKECGIHALELLKELQVICMGKQTMAAVAGAGLTSHGIPETATKEALVKYLTGQPFLEV